MFDRWNIPSLLLSLDSSTECNRWKLNDEGNISCGHLIIHPDVYNSNSWTAKSAFLMSAKRQHQEVEH